MKADTHEYVNFGICIKCAKNPRSKYLLTCRQCYEEGNEDESDTISDN